MRLTDALKAWAAENCDVSADAKDTDVVGAVSTALATGKLTPEKFAELSAEPEDGQANEFAGLLKQIADGQQKLVEAIAGSKADEATPEPEKKAEPEEEKKSPPEDKGGGDHGWYEKMVARMSAETPEQPSGDARVKGAWESYGTTKTMMTYPTRTKNQRPHQMAGQPVMNYAEGGRALDIASEQEMAVNGAFAKFLVQTARLNGGRRAAFASLPQHDKELIYYALEKYRWCGSTEGGDYADIKDRHLTPSEQKTIIDEIGAGSQGGEAVPIAFDDAIISTPLLHGELFPLVNLVDVPRGSRMEAVMLGQSPGTDLTITWGGIDDSDIALFTTTDYVQAFDTTIRRGQGAIQLGLDFLSDTPLAFGQWITQRYGERMLESLDNVIASGDGTTQPQSVILGTTNTSAWGGATSIGNYESLLFLIAKAELTPDVMSSFVFCSNQTNYRRARALAVGGTDVRRLAGIEDYHSYRWLGYPFKINESFADNTQVFVGPLKRYRMYRRRGLTIRTTQEGVTLMQDNSMAIFMTFRFGGQVERSAAFAETTTAPA